MHCIVHHKWSTKSSMLEHLVVVKPTQPFRLSYLTKAVVCRVGAGYLNGNTSMMVSIKSRPLTTAQASRGDRQGNMQEPSWKEMSNGRADKGQLFQTVVVSND